MKPHAIDRYAAAAALHGDCTRRGDPETGNQAYAKMIEALQELRETEDRGERDLCDLTHHPNDSVKVWASTHLLPLRDRPALEVLERLASSSSESFIQFDAKMVLREWKAGRLRSP